MPCSIKSDDCRPGGNGATRASAKVARNGSLVVLVIGFFSPRRRSYTPAACFTNSGVTTCLTASGTGTTSMLSRFT